MKKISVIIPCYNEENSVMEMYSRLVNVFQDISQYDYEIIFADDCSPDNTWQKIVEICQNDPKVKGIHNVTNFGSARNIFQSLKYGNGDAIFLLMGDLQQPPEMLKEFVKYWGDGYRAVIGVHLNTEQKGFIALCRKVYYKYMAIMSSKKIIPNFGCYGLYDKKFIDVLHAIEDTQPFFTGIVAEYAGRIKIIPVKQENSLRGRSNLKFMKKYDYAMIGFTSYTKIMMRIATFLGFFIGITSFIIAIIVFIIKLINWDSYPAGIPSVLIGVFFLGAVQIFFLGIMGEYVLSINERSMRRPLTVVDQRLNFDEKDEQI